MILRLKVVRSVSIEMRREDLPQDQIQEIETIVAVVIDQIILAILQVEEVVAVVVAEGEEGNSNKTIDY